MKKRTSDVFETVFCVANGISTLAQSACLISFLAIYFVVLFTEHGLPELRLILCELITFCFVCGMSTLIIYCCSKRILLTFFLVTMVISITALFAIYIKARLPADCFLGVCLGIFFGLLKIPYCYYYWQD